jgi:hypothetical protein
VGIDHRRVTIGAPARRAGFDDGHRARGLAHWHRIHQDQALVAVEQFVSQVDAADAEVGDAHARWHGPGRQAVSDLDTEAVIA